jgi:hypothetical protein
MKIRIQMLFEEDNGKQSAVMEVFSFQREEFCAENLGFSLAEAKECLTKLQEKLAQEQVKHYSQ